MMPPTTNRVRPFDFTATSLSLLLALGACGGGGSDDGGGEATVDSPPNGVADTSLPNEVDVPADDSGTAVSDDTLHVVDASGGSATDTRFPRTPGGLGDEITGEVNSWGLLRFDNERFRRQVEIGGEFVTFGDADIAVADIFGDYRVPLDGCSVLSVRGGVTGFSAGNSDLLVPGGVEGTRVDAGEAIPVTGPDGTLGELTRSDANFYFLPTAVDETWVPPLPAPLTLDVPGAEFPAFFDVTVPPLEPLIVSSRGEAGGGPDEQRYAWTSGSNPDAVIRLRGLFDDSEDDRRHAFVCHAIDDGEFELPPAVREIAAGSRAPVSATMTRLAWTIEQQGDAVLIVRSSDASN